jgi:hypothetical protein
MQKPVGDSSRCNANNQEWMDANPTRRSYGALDFGMAADLKRSVAPRGLSSGLSFAYGPRVMRTKPRDAG